MKIAHLIMVVGASSLISLTSLQAAPVESVDSAAANPALQRVDAFLSQKAVAAQLSKLGVTPAQAQARVARLNDAQLAQLAGQVDKLQAGGDIQGGNPHPLGPIGCVFSQIGATIRHIVRTLFCWTDVP